MGCNVIFSLLLSILRRKLINFGAVKHLLIILIAITPCLMAGSCHKHASCVTSGGGKGGTASLAVTPTHLNIYIDSCMVYIKYGTLDDPADGIYDDSQKCVLNLPDTIPVATFSNLTPGIYYLYGSGYHTGYSPPYVKGAASYTVCNEQAYNTYLPTYSY